METEPWIDRERATWKVLPLHPQPQPLESFSSYITRLAEANGLQSINELATLAGARWSRVYARPDYPCLPYEGLARIAGCTEEVLEQMTFQNLAQRFSCPTHPMPLRRFLQGSLAPNLRYCPRCLAEHSPPYYRLPWRFLAVQGCHRHHCVLLDQCGHCGFSLPLVTRSPRMARCSSCRRGLRTCQVSSLTAEAAQSVLRHTITLELLLSSKQRKQVNSNEMPTVEIGKCFAMLRQGQHLSMAQVVHLSGRNEQIVLEIEHGNLNRKASLDDYVWYADRLDSSLSTIMEMPLIPAELPATEESLLKLVDDTAQRLQEQGKSTTPAQIARSIGISLQYLRSFPTINTLLIAWEHLHKCATATLNEQREEELVQRVRYAIEHLNLLGESVTRQRIAQLVGMSYAGLCLYPQVDTLLLEINIDSNRSLQKPFVTRWQERREAIMST